MAFLVRNDTDDFESIMEDCLVNFGDTSAETRQNRVRDWLWLTKSNHTLNQTDTSELDEEDAKSDLAEIMHEVSNFINKTDKEIICLYYIMNYPKYLGEFKLDENLINESMNLDNQDVNVTITKWAHIWTLYNDSILRDELKAMSDVMGPDVIDDIFRNAPTAFKEPSIGNLTKQFAKRGYDRLDNWDELYEQLKTIKEKYRFSFKYKNELLFPNTSLAKTMSYQEFNVRAYKLRDDLYANLKDQGVFLNGSFD